MGMANIAFGVRVPLILDLYLTVAPALIPYLSVARIVALALPLVLTRYGHETTRGTCMVDTKPCMVDTKPAGGACPDQIWAL